MCIFACRSHTDLVFYGFIQDRCRGAKRRVVVRFLQQWRGIWPFYTRTRSFLWADGLATDGRAIRFGSSIKVRTLVFDHFITYSSCAHLSTMLMISPHCENFRRLYLLDYLLNSQLRRKYAVVSTHMYGRRASSFRWFCDCHPRRRNTRLLPPPAQRLPALFRYVTLPSLLSPSPFFPVFFKAALLLSSLPGVHRFLASSFPRVFVRLRFFSFYYLMPQIPIGGFACAATSSPRNRACWMSDPPPTSTDLRNRADTRSPPAFPYGRKRHRAQA